MAAEPGVDGPTILARAEAIAPLLQAEAGECERRRCLTAPAVEALRSTGVFRMAMPREWGGPEVNLLTQIEIIERLSRADGSAGWCAMVGADGGYYSAALDDDVGRRLFPDLDTITAGWIQPAGRLRLVGGGYELTGRWQFASGCTHADVIIAGAIVYRDGAPLIVDGRPEWRVAVLEADRFEIIETWQPLGLAGTGSHDYSADGMYVPAEQTFRLGTVKRNGALYAWPGMFMTKLLGVPLGIARAALDAAEEMLAGKILFPDMRPARDDARVRAGIARAEALVGAARSYVHDVAGEFWLALSNGAEPSPRQRAALASCKYHTVRTCREATELVADTVGSAAVLRASPIERHLRDLLTLSQHAATQLKMLEVSGALWIDGADREHPLLVNRIL